MKDNGNTAAHNGDTVTPVEDIIISVYAKGMATANTLEGELANMVTNTTIKEATESLNKHYGEMMLELAKSVEKELDHCTDDVVIYPAELRAKIKEALQL